MSNDKKLTGPIKDLNENFERVESVGYSLWMFKSGSLDPDAAYFGEAAHLFQSHSAQVFQSMTPTLRSEATQSCFRI